MHRAISQKPLGGHGCQLSATWPEHSLAWEKHLDYDVDEQAAVAAEGALAYLLEVSLRLHADVGSAFHIVQSFDQVTTST